MTRARSLLICTRPADYGAWRVREAAEHLLAQPNVSEEDKRLASDALEKASAAPAADASPEAAPNLRAGHAALPASVHREKEMIRAKMTHGVTGSRRIAILVLFLFGAALVTSCTGAPAFMPEDNLSACNHSSR
jgi:hypothetical protein